ncbi:MAG: NAD-dependent epimerase/dehydratase family protein [Planctomycetota bacterium]
MPTALLLGGSGFLGRWLVRTAPGAFPRDSIITVGRRPMPDAPEGSHIVADLAVPGAAALLVTTLHPTHVFLVTKRTTGTPEEMLAIHGDVTQEVVATALGRGLRVIVAGSSAELGPSDGRRTPLDESAPANPVTTYGRCKLDQATTAQRLRGVLGAPEVVHARLFNLIGPGLPDGLVPADLARRVVDAERAGGDVEVGRVDAVRDFLDVRDAADVLWELALSKETGLFHVGSGVGTRIGDLAASFIAQALRPCRLVPREVPASPSDVDWQVACIDKVRKATAWEPRTPLVQSVRDMLEAVRADA